MTGDAAILGAGVRYTSLLRFHINVEPGAHLRVADVGTSTGELETVSFTVRGSLRLQRVQTVYLYSSVLTVHAGGGAIIEDSIIGSAFSPVIVSDGTIILARTTLDILHTEALANGGAFYWGATASHGAPFESAEASYCTGVAPTSVGYNRTNLLDCALTSPTDSDDFTIGEFENANNDFDFVPENYSPLVDAIPLGVLGCSADAVDVYGNPRGVDGNGDGILGCDIGAVERQPDLARVSPGSDRRSSPAG